MRANSTLEFLKGVAESESDVAVDNGDDCPLLKADAQIILDIMARSEDAYKAAYDDGVSKGREEKREEYNLAMRSYGHVTAENPDRAVNDFARYIAERSLHFALGRSNSADSKEKVLKEILGR